MKLGDSVIILTNSVCYAPPETVGELGFVVEVLDTGLYRNKVLVRFLEPFCGYNSWIYDMDELILDTGGLDVVSRSAYM